jgi:hypothetical protein
MMTILKAKPYFTHYLIAQEDKILGKAYRYYLEVESKMVVVETAFLKHLMNQIILIKLTRSKKRVVVCRQLACTVKLLERRVQKVRISVSFQTIPGCESYYARKESISR